MKKLLFLLILLPVVVQAQLGKVTPGMSEPEFRKALPEAYRDWDIEAYWIKDVTAFGKIAGESQWESINDTIRRYWFKSEPVYGPSVKFKTIDSTKVHAMKTELEKLRAEYEIKFGKPSASWNSSLTSFPASETDVYCYNALWTLADGKTIHLSISRDIIPENLINAGYLGDSKKSEVYTMHILIDSWDPFFKTKYGLGLSRKQFVAKFPSLAGEMPNEGYKVYTLPHDDQKDNVRWFFVFEDGELLEFAHGGEAGTGYGARSDEEAYAAFKLKAEKLLAEGNAAYGAPDSLSNTITPKYEPRSRQVSYDREYLFVRWKCGEGFVELSFNEWGGGKYPDVVFSLELFYIEED